MSYKATKDDIAFAKQIYDTIILTQVLNPVLIKEAYKRLFGEDAQNGQQAKIKVSAYFIYQYKAEELIADLDDLFGVDKTDSASKTGSAADTTYVGIAQSHSEDLQPDEMSPLELLEAQYELAEDANEKRSHKMKINKLKKAQDGKNNS